MSDPAAGTWEFAGGHIEGQESPRAAAIREWQEETGLRFPDGEWTGEWTSSDGIYQGFILTVPSEADIDLAARMPGTDPDGDAFEAVAWWNPADLPGNPALRPELAADLDAVMSALGCTEGAAGTPSEGDESACPCGTPVVYDELNGWQHADGSVSHDDGESVSDKMGAVAKAAGARPKGPTLDVRNLTGVWAEVYDRREKLLRKHLKAVAAAWDACVAELGSPRVMVRQLRSMVVPVAKLADPNRPRWKDAGTAAALAWLQRLSKAKGYPALVAALEDAIRSGMAQGEADALALAADRQGKAGFAVDRAFRAAYKRLAGDAGIAQQAQDAASGIIDGAAGDIGRVLADQAGDDGSEDDMTGAVDEALSGDESQSVGLGTDWWFWGALGAGALALAQAAGVQTYDWFDVGDERECPTCMSNASGSPYALGDLPSFPAHPRCRCDVQPSDPLPLSFLADFLS